MTLIEELKALHAPIDRPTSNHYDCDDDECDRAGEGRLAPWCPTCTAWAPCKTARLIAEYEAPAQEVVAVTDEMVEAALFSLDQAVYQPGSRGGLVPTKGEVRAALIAALARSAQPTWVEGWTAALEWLTEYGGPEGLVLAEHMKTRLPAQAAPADRAVEPEPLVLETPEYDYLKPESGS